MNVDGKRESGEQVRRTRGGLRCCEATNAAGEPCGAPALRGSAYCFAHARDEETVKRRKEAARLGGATTSNRRKVLLGTVDFSSAETVRGFFEGLTRAVLRGELPPAKALAASQIGEASLRVKAGIELGERLDSLESRIQEAVEGRLGQG